jgi:hypothetical protein
MQNARYPHNVGQKIPSHILCSLLVFWGALDDQSMIYIKMCGFQWTLLRWKWLKIGVSSPVFDERLAYEI